MVSVSKIGVVEWKFVYNITKSILKKMQNKSSISFVFHYLTAYRVTNVASVFIAVLFQVRGYPGNLCICFTSLPRECTASLTSFVSIAIFFCQDDHLFAYYLMILKNEVGVRYVR